MMELEYLKFNGHRRFSRQFSLLKGLIQGIQADGEIDDREMNELITWCLNNEEFIRYQPFRDLIPIIKDAVSDGVLTEDEIADIIWIIKSFERDDIIGDLRTQMLNQLYGTIYGILADNELRDLEIRELDRWINENEFLKGLYPYDEIESVVTATLVDGKISSDERNLLLALISTFIDASESREIDVEHFRKLREEYSISGICIINPNIKFGEKVFCFTGISDRTNRKDIASVIESQGGVYKDTVTAKTDYLVVGNDTNPCWAFSCYGRKVEKAMELRKKGSEIQIISEIDFWDSLD